MNAAAYDVFISYSHRHDRDLALGTYDALVARGLRVFVDDVEIPEFHGISVEVLDGIARSRAMLAVFSPDYLTRPAYCAELDLALGIDPERVLVLNPVADASHISPAQLRDRRFHLLSTAGEAPDLEAAAERIAARLDELPDEPFDDDFDGALAADETDAHRLGRRPDRVDGETPFGERVAVVGVECAPRCAPAVVATIASRSRD
jgi:hypothetical protein